jgi:adhesin/invasin
VNFIVGPPSAATSTIAASPTSIPANSTSTATITVQLRDANNHLITTGGAAVVLNTTAGTLSSVTDNGNGTYSATLTSAATPGSATITGTLNGTAMASSATVTFGP